MNRSATTTPRLHAYLFWAALTLSTAAYPQQTKAVDASAPPASAEESEPSAEEKTKQELAEIISQVAQYQTALDELKGRRSQFEGMRQEMLQEMLNARIERTLDQLISFSHKAAKAYLDKANIPGFDTERSRVIKILESLPVTVGEEIERIRRNLKLPRPEQTPMEQAALGADLAEAAERDDKLVQALIANTEFAERIDLDVSAAKAAIRRHLARSAENASAYLDVTSNDLKKLRRQLRTLPKNKDLAERIAVTEQHMLLAAEILRRRAERMDSLGMKVAAFDAQLIAATGSLSTKIFDWSVMKGLARDFFNSIVDWIEANGARMMFQLLVFLVILAVAWKIARLGELIVQRALGSMRANLSQLLQRMIISTTRSVIIVLGLLIGLSQLDVSIGPLLAGLGIAGFIVGFALQDSLSNFASGLMILLYRPFDVGDIVEVSGAFGTVRHMSLVNTTILAFDNQSLVVPNNQVWRNVIKNVTGQATRRVDMTFGISYGDDIEQAERVLREIVTSTEKVLKVPEPVIHLHELGDSSVNFIVRPWVKTEDYWDTYWTITRQVKLRFDAEGISIPFPQRDVHLYTQAPRGAS